MKKGKAKKSNNNLQRFFAFCLTLLIIDQLLKLMVVLGKLPGSLNAGISFGLLPSPLWLAANLLIIILLIVIYTKSGQLLLLLLLSAGISNLLDRILYGGVIDYLFLPHFLLKLNLSDILISTSIILLLEKAVSQNWPKSKNLLNTDK